MKNINLPCFGIEIELIGPDHCQFGTIKSKLHSPDESPTEKTMFNAIERLVLAHACFGVDVSTNEYVAGLESAVDVILRQHSH
jgi:hypothetical protein